MDWLSNQRIEQTRQSERARFQRWFVPTTLARAYIDRQGRPRAVSEAEFLGWQDQVHGIVEDMLAKLRYHTALMVVAMLVTLATASFIATLLGFTGTARTVMVSVSVVIVEAGLLGLEIHDYWARWQRLRDAIEAAVVGRAPLPFDPERARIPHNWAQTAQYVIAVSIIALYFSSHLYTGLIEAIDWRWMLALVPIAWALHFAGRRHDRAAQERLGR
jgi:hypothetical protein